MSALEAGDTAMPPAPKWTSTETARLRELHAAGRSLHAIAKEMGRAKSTVEKHAKRAGLTWDRGPTKAATQAKKADAEARRAQLKLDLLIDAQRLREQLWQPHTYFDWGGKDHDFDEHTVDEPTPTDKLKLIQATSAAINSYGRLEQLDTATDTSDARSLLADLGKALGVNDGT